MKNGSYGVLLCTLMASSICAMNTETAKHNYDLVKIMYAAVEEAKKSYKECNAGTKDAATLKQILDDTFYDHIKKNNIPNSAIDTLHDMIVREADLEGFLSDITHRNVQGVVTGLDIGLDERTILVGAGDRIQLWKKDENEWIRVDSKQHASPITAVCLAGNNRAVSTDQKGFVHIWGYDTKLTEGTAFRFAEPYTATMIALNDEGALLAHGNISKNVPIYVRKSLAAYWENPDDIVEAHELMTPMALGWTVDDNLIVYGQESGAVDTEGRYVTEWKKIERVWCCIKKMKCNKKNEDYDLAIAKCHVTRKGLNRAATAWTGTAVMANGTEIIIAEPFSSPSFDEVINLCADHWQ